MTNRKSALVIMPRYFGYEEKINEYLKDKNIDADVIFENVDNFNLYYRFIYVYASNLKEKVMERYYEKRINAQKKYDYVLVIRGESVSKKILRLLRERNPDAQFILYQWDSIKNNPNVETIAKYFDSCFTFDPVDAQRQGWTYRPLFFSFGAKRKEKRKYDLTYICSLHSQRVQIYNKLKEVAIDNSLKSFLYLYAPKIVFLKNRYFSHKEDFQGINSVKYKPLSLEETNSIYSQSNIIVDYAHPGQVGLTMRTIESIGNRCKLVTNNKFIKECDIYNSNNVYIYEGTNLAIPEDFLKKPYQELAEEQYYYYSLDGWIDCLIGAKNEKNK